MARIRTLKPEFFRSRSLARCSLAARITFAGLWCEADDHGRGIADARILKGSLWPLEDDVTAYDVDEHLDQLEKTEHVRLYTIDDERYYEIVEWEKHQAAAYRRGAAVHPAPPGQPIASDSEPAEQESHDDACTNVQDAEPIVLEGKGTGRELGTGSALDKRAQDPMPDPVTPRLKGSRIPIPFDLTDAMSDFALRNFPHRGPKWVERETEKFVDFWRAKAGKDAVKLDWASTWRNWLRRADEGMR